MAVTDPNFVAWGDSSLSQTGGFSHDLKFWWHWEWPDSIQARTLSAYQLKAKIDDKLISINLLEYTCDTARSEERRVTCGLHM